MSAELTPTSSPARPARVRRRRQRRDPLSPRSVSNRARTTNTGLLPGIDQRSTIARRYHDLVAQACADQGGADRCSEARLQLVRRFAALAVQAETLEVKLANGGEIDIAEYTALTSTLVRVVARLGINRVARNITPDPLEYARRRSAAAELVHGPEHP